ncbi:hypothetical protein VTL71DRAFT_4812 [Oculimacula yallundae]|uniref:Uncharacterized protein n=1 Tax=Oculimacula yallundae TaxID=86028 RepID=A0ABR4C2Z2_9HELO
MPGLTHSHYVHRYVAPDARMSKYHTPYLRPDSCEQGVSTTTKQGSFAQRIQALESSSTTSNTSSNAINIYPDVSDQVASALARWGIPSKNWIKYYNGRYVWPDEIVVQDSPTLGLNHPFKTTATAVSTNFESRPAIGVLQPEDGSRLSSRTSSSVSGRKQIRRAPASQTSSLRDQYSIGSSLPSIDSASSSNRSSQTTSDKRSEEEIYLPPGFIDTNPSCDNLIDLIAIVRHIVPAGGLDPNINYGVFERLKYSHDDTDEKIENFVRNAEAEDPDFLDKLTGFASGRPGVFKGGSPSEAFHRQDMLKRGYVCYEGEWIKGEEAEVQRVEVQKGRLVVHSQGIRLNSYQPHPAQFEDELAYQVDYRYAEVEDDNTREADLGYDADCEQSRGMKGGMSKRGAGKKSLGAGMNRRRSTTTNKLKKESKQQKMDRTYKANTRRS